MAKPRKPKNEDQKPDNSVALVQHQKLCLSIDMDNSRIYGYTELKVLVPENGLVGLHADNMVIESVLVEGEKADYEFFPHFQFLDDDTRYTSVTSPISASEAASSSYISSLDKELAPNLLILCSKEVKSATEHQVDEIAEKIDKMETDTKVETNGDKEEKMEANAEQEKEKMETNTEKVEVNANAENNSQSPQEVKQSVKIIRIDYWIEKTETGIHFENNVLHTDNQIRRAHCWFPCIDDSSQHCCYDMEFTVAQNFVAVSNGTLLYQVLSKDDPPRKTFVYKLSVPVTAGWISLVVAQFKVLPDRHSGIISHMCLSPDFSKLRNTVAFFHSAFSHYEDYLAAPFPFGSYKQVFIAPEMAITSLSVGASLGIFTSQVLFDEKVIDQTIDTRIKLAYALARQWFGVFITADGPNDEWLLDGLAGFLTDSFIKRFLGNNEARYRRYKANSAVCKADVGGASTLSSSASTNLYGTQCVGLYGKIRSWKSVAILQMLEKQMGPESFRKILQGIISRAQVTSRSRTLSTKEFRHLSNKVGNLERPFLKEFFPRWVGSCGCPVLRMGLSYNKRKNMIELAVLRGCTAAQDSVTLDPSGNPDAENRDADVGWPGMMSIRVHELDGMYDHPILPMSGDDLQLVEIQCHSKLASKRLQKPKKGTKPDGSDDNGDIPTPDLRANAESPLLWLRADPQMEYLAEIHFNQPIQMWINQLEKDKDVVAQAQAISTLEALPQLSFSVVNALYNFLSDSKAFWRVRIEAAFALAHTASEDTDWAGLVHLVKFYKSRRFDESMGLPRPNDFHDFSEYFVLEAIPLAIAMVRATDKKSPREAVEFVLQLLKYNDNNGNPYSDVYWLAALVQSIGELEFGQQSILFLSSLLKRIDRLLQFDRLMPSYNGILTISCIRSLTQIALKLSASVPLDRVSELIKPFRGMGTSWKVRIEASRALLDIEFHSSGIEAALLLFIRYIEEEKSLRGQVKLAVHAMRLCQIQCQSEVVDEIKGSTLALLLRLLESRKAFCNVFLRHHLFCILQVLSGRSPTLYGVPRIPVQPSGEMETCSEQSKGGSLLKLKMSTPPEPLMDSQNLLPNTLPVPEVPRDADTVSNGSEWRRPLPVPEAPREADTISYGNERRRPLPVSEAPREADTVSYGSERRRPLPVSEAPREADTISNGSEWRRPLPVSEAPREADTVSNGSERRRPVVKIRVKHSAASSRADDTENVVIGPSKGGGDETERGGSSSMSVDAPTRMGDEPTNVDCQILEEVNSCHDRDSRVTASIGSVKLVNSEDETRKELQCTADSSKLECEPQPEDRSSPNFIQGNGVESDAQKYVSLQALSIGAYDDVPPQAVGGPIFPGKEKKEKKKKDKDKKRKREKEHKGSRDDPEYLEKKRLKKEKKKKEKEMRRLQSRSADAPLVDLPNTNIEHRVTSVWRSGDGNPPMVEQQRSVETSVRSASVELKPDEPSGSKLVIRTSESKGDASEGSSVHKIRIKIKKRSLNN